MFHKNLIDDIGAFTCLMYSNTREKSTITVRSVMLKKMVGVDVQLSSKSGVNLTHLPTARDNLIPHIWRVNHRITFENEDSDDRMLIIDGD